MEQHETDVYDLGLAADLEMLKRSPIDRRRLLKLGAVGLGVLLTGGGTLLASAATSQQNAGATSGSSVVATSSATATTCVTEIPQETAGPYPADGSNASNQRLNALALSGIVRSDIRTSLGTGNVAAGVPCTVVLTLVNTNAGCAPLAGYAVYLWHCTSDGKYSMYSSGVTGEDYLRGVQAADANGTLTFTSIFPGCYAGRWPHIHFEVYQSLATATSASNVVHTSQLALPQDICETVYATTGYGSSTQNLSQISLATDNIFSDGSSLQVATVTGDVSSGYTAHLTVGIAA